MAVSDLNIRIQASFRDFDKSMRQIERRLQQSAQTFGNIGNAMAGAITLPLAALGATAISAAGDFEQMSNSLNTVMIGAGYSVNQTAAELEKLRKISLAPGIDMEQAVKGSIRLQSVGYSAEKARNVLVELANALSTSGGDAQQLDGVTRQFAQMSAKGKVMQEDLTIILENMPSLAKVLMDTFGTTNAEAIRNMGVNAEQFIDKITEGLSKTERAQGGIKNAITNAQMALKSFFATIGAEINKAYDLNAIAGTIGDKLKAMADAFRNLDPETKKSIISFALYAAAAGPIVKIFQGLYSGAALAVAGIRAIAGTLGGLHASAVKAYTAFNALSGAMKFTYVGAAVAAVAGLYMIFQHLNDEVIKAQHTTIALNDIERSATDAVSEQKIQVQSLIGVLQDETTAKGDKLAAIKKLNDISPEYFGNLKLEGDKVIGLTTSYDGYIENLLRAARVKAAEAKLIEIDRKKLDLAEKLAKQESARAQSFQATTGGFGSVVAFEKQALDTKAQLINEIKREISAVESEEKAIISVVKANLDLGDANKKVTASLNSKNKSDTEGASVVDKGTKANEKYKEVLSDLNNELAKAKLLGSEITFDQQVEGIEGAITKLLNAGFSPDDPRVQNFIEMMRTLRGESLKDVPLIPSPELPKSVASDGTFKGDQRVKGVKQEVKETTQAYIELGESVTDWMVKMNLSKTGMDAVAEGLYAMRDASQEAFTGVANSLMGVEGAYTRVGVAALIAAMQMVKAALAATLAKAIQQSVTRSGHPLLGIALAGVATAGINALFGKIQQSVSKVPKFAKGAVVYGPTLAMVGDNRGASVDPEVIAPLSKLKNIIGSSNGGAVEVYGRISGRDILLANRRSEADFNRIR